MIAVAGGVIEKDGKILMVTEAKAKYYGLLNIPAGHMEDGETPVETAIREVKEETGLDVKVKSIMHIDFLDVDGEKVVGFVFRCEVISGNIEFNSKEILKVGFYDINELLENPKLLRNSKFLIHLFKNVQNHIEAPLDLLRLK